MRLLCLRTINLKAKLEYLRKETKISEMIARPPRIYILVIFRKILTQITIHIYIYLHKLVILTYIYISYTYILVILTYIYIYI